MNVGKQTRLNRIFSNASGRICTLAIDHFIAYQDGLPEGLRDLPETLRTIMPAKPDAVTMHKGTAMSCWGPYAGKVPLIVQSVIGRPDDSADADLATPEDAVRLAADAFAVCAFVRGPTEVNHLRRVADFVRAAGPWDMPVIAHSYPRVYADDGTIEISFEPEHVAWAVRCAFEVGVDIIKVPYTGDPESYRQIIESCPVPIVAAGGPKTETLQDALDLAAGVVAAGAAGMTIGRNIWGASDPAEAMKAFKAVIHR